MSALNARLMSAFGGKADIRRRGGCPKGQFHPAQSRVTMPNQFPPVDLVSQVEHGQTKEDLMQPGMKLLKYSACAVGIVLSMLVGTPRRHLEAAGNQDCKLTRVR